ncbi:MAG: carboxy terminal-processing peptidase [Bacteroidales bacterium]|nr:carboxy terminal-processing peptidase [Bacteroidales bacterium]
MKKYKYRLLFIPVMLMAVSILLFAHKSGNSDDQRRELLIKVMQFAINSGHYQPGSFNDSFSSRAFGIYIERLDYNKRFLLREDYLALKKFENKLDDAFLQINFEFLDKSVDIIEERIDESDKYFHDILSRPFDFSKDEILELDPEKLDFAASHAELKDRWRLSLKYETLVRLNDMLEEQEKAMQKSDTVTEKSFSELEAEAREKILERYEDWFHRLSQLNEDDRLNLYVNSLVNVLDPHTQYFPPRDKENFDIRFSGQLEGIGAQLTQKDIYIEVVRIVPGSPSWKLGELEVGDQILKVKQENEEPVDVVDMRLDDAVQLIRGPKGSTVTLTVKKLDGNLRDISIVRDVVILEETYAKSAVVTDPESNIKIGYIKLPSFYVDFDNKEGRKCSEDIRKELAKLEKEKIEGLIFDLRDNGGGSLEDVVSIAGLFIDQGPVVQVNGKGGTKRVLRDNDAGIHYDGPLLVMVNPISASASEIFAAAMKDYGRALIIGSSSTYGKGTVQNFTELDRMVSRAPGDMAPLGSLKMTVQKFYRINGESTQLKGVVPDVVMPDYYSYIDFGEKDLDFAMEWDEIQPLPYNHWNASYDFDFISGISSKRIAGDTLFMLVDENGKRLKDIREETGISLNYDAFKRDQEKREEEGKKYDRIGKDTLGLQPFALQEDRLEMANDTAKIARTEAWLTNLKKDVYLFEAMNIMQDIREYRAGKAKKED